MLQLVPNLEDAEYKREREFYEERGLPCPKDMEAETEKEAQEEEEETEEKEETETSSGGAGDYHRFEEQVNLLLESADTEKMKNISRKYVRVSSMATITHLKKFLSLKVLENPDPESFRDIDITCDGERIPQVSYQWYSNCSDNSIKLS